MTDERKSYFFSAPFSGEARSFEWMYQENI
jgi:hypothetical protein